MKRLGYLFERTVSFENLYLAASDAFKGKKGKENVARFYFGLEPELLKLEQELKSGTYLPSPYGTFRIFEPKERQICCSGVRDRVVHHAICRTLEPIFERRYIYDTYACRIGKGTHRALKRAQDFMRRVTGGRVPGYYLKCDIKKYFYSIDHGILKNLLSRLIKDPSFNSLLTTIIDHQVPGNLPGKGLPIGNLTSQYFANLYLRELDHFIKEQLRVPFYLRYMDDFLLFSEEKARLRELLSMITEFLEERLSLEVKERATKLAPISEGVPFLGFRLFPGLTRLQRPGLVRLRRKVRARERKYLAGEISVEEMTQSVASQIAHAAHADSTRLRRNIFEVSMKFG